MIREGDRFGVDTGNGVLWFATIEEALAQYVECLGWGGKATLVKKLEVFMTAEGEPECPYTM